MKDGMELITDRVENRLRCDYFTLTIYFRLFIPDLFPEYDKGLYIDSDVVVPGDISELYNHDLKDINFNEVRNNISYVSQNDSLLPGTILYNILLDEDYNDLKFRRISSLLYLDKIINNKVNGINTVIRDNLSGGEKQRIILARALYKKFDVLLLDEALSEVDYDLRTKIVSNINHYYKNKTIIMVSHNEEKYKFDKVVNLTVRKDRYVR